MKKISTGILGLLFFASAALAHAKTNTTYVSMERTNCFGTCPNYVIEIYSTGLVRYTGRKFAEPTGVYEKNIGTAGATKLLKLFDNYRIDTCQNTYENRVQDVPALIYTIKYKGKTKTIHNAHFGPGFLNTLATEIDKVPTPGKSKGWKKKSSYKEN